VVHVVEELADVGFRNPVVARGKHIVHDRQGRGAALPGRKPCDRLLNFASKIGVSIWTPPAARSGHVPSECQQPRATIVLTDRHAAHWSAAIALLLQFLLQLLQIGRRAPLKLGHALTIHPAAPCSHALAPRPSAGSGRVHLVVQRIPLPLLLPSCSCGCRGAAWLIPVVFDRRCCVCRLSVKRQRQRNLQHQPSTAGNAPFPAFEYALLISACSHLSATALRRPLPDAAPAGAVSPLSWTIAATMAALTSRQDFSSLACAFAKATAFLTWRAGPDGISLGYAQLRFHRADDHLPMQLPCRASPAPSGLAHCTGRLVVRSALRPSVCLRPLVNGPCGNANRRC